MVAVQFSAMHSARNPGNRKFISAGASVPGVRWNSISTPSMVWVSPVTVTSWVGASKPLDPKIGVPRPSPESTWPRSVRGSSIPYMYNARRFMAVPAITFSLAAASKNPPGPGPAPCPSDTSSGSTTPRIPPKWSMWLWVMITATTGRGPRCSLISAMAAAEVSADVSVSMTIQPVSPATTVRLDRSRPRTCQMRSLTSNNPDTALRRA